MIPRVQRLDEEPHRGDAFHRGLQERDRPCAVTLTEQMTADDWQELNAIWRERPPGWQCCLATVLASVAPEMSIPWLFEIIEAGDDAIALHAIDELRDMQREHSLISPWPPWPLHVLRRVRDLWGRHRGFTAPPLQQLLDDMASGQLSPTGEPGARFGAPGRIVS
jgi:hypothetical protein